MSSSEILWVHSNAEKRLVGGAFDVGASVGEDLGRDNGITDEEVRVDDLGETTIISSY